MKKILSVVLACLMLSALCAVAASAGSVAGFTPVDIAKTSKGSTINIDGKFEASEDWGTPIVSLNGYDECVKVCHDAGSGIDFAEYVKDVAHVPFGLDVYVRWDDSYFYYCGVMKIADRFTGDWYDTALWNADGLICSCTLESNVDDGCDDERSRWNWSELDDGSQNFTIYDNDPFGVDLESLEENCRAHYDAASQTMVYEMKAPWSNLLDPADFTAKLGSVFCFRDLYTPTTKDTPCGNPVDMTPSSTEGKYYWKMTLVDEPVVETEVPAADTVAEGGDVVAPVDTNTNTADTVAALAVVCVLAAGAVVVAKKKF